MRGERRLRALAQLRGVEQMHLHGAQQNGRLFGQRLHREHRLQKIHPGSEEKFSAKVPPNRSAAPGTVT